MERQYILFNLNRAHYAIPIEYVNEITDFMEIMVIPKLPHNIKGIINFRGNPIPVLDIEKEFGLKENFYEADNSRLIVLNYDDVEFALQVEDASKTICIGDDCVKDISNISIGFQSQYIKGVGVKDKKLIFILDICKLISS